MVRCAMMSLLFGEALELVSDRGLCARRASRSGSWPLTCCSIALSLYVLDSEASHKSWNYASIDRGLKACTARSTCAGARVVCLLAKLGTSKYIAGFWLDDLSRRPT